MFEFLNKTKRPVDIRSDELCAALLPLWRSLIDTVAGIGGQSASWHEAGLYVGAMVLVEWEDSRGADIARLRTDFVARWLVHIEMILQDRGCPPAEQLTGLLLERYPVYRMVSTDADAPAQQLTMHLFEHCVGPSLMEDFWKTLPAVDAVARLTSEVRAKARLADGR